MLRQARIKGPQRQAVKEAGDGRISMPLCSLQFSVVLTSGRELHNVSNPGSITRAFPLAMKSSPNASSSGVKRNLMARPECITRFHGIWNIS